MKKSTKIVALVLAVGITGLGIGTAAAMGGPGGFQGGFPRMMMQNGTGEFTGGGPGMMMQHRQRFMGRFGDRKLNLSESQVKTLMEARLIMRGNDRLKIGKIARKDDKTYLVDIVTVDDSLVQQIEIDKDSGFPSRRPFKKQQ